MSIISDYLNRDWPTSPTEIPNVGRDDLALYFAEAGLNRGVEIGTERGEYAEILCRANPNLVLDCIDPYKAYKAYREHTSQEKLDAIYNEAKFRLSDYPVRFVKEFSAEAHRHYRNGELDFIYLDGNHSLFHVIQDLYYWVPKVRVGGCISGHDMIRRNNRLRYQCHVVEAVYAYTQCYMIDKWFIVGAKDEQEGVKRDTIRSFFWIKQ